MVPVKGERSKTKEPALADPICVVLSESGLKEVVYNDFHIGENSDVVIVAGCGIHNCGDQDSTHNGIHTFHIGKGARIRYVEKHYGEGEYLEADEDFFLLVDVVLVGCAP